MTRRNTVFWVVAISLAVLIAGGLSVRHFWRENLQAIGIQQLDWQGLSLSWNRLSISQLIVMQAHSGRQVTVRADKALLAWSWHGPEPTVQSLAIGQLTVDLDTRSQEAGPSPEPSTLLMPEQVPAWLPPTLTVHEFNAQLPCVTGQCRLSGSFSVIRPERGLPIEVILGLDHQGHHLDLQTRVSGRLPDHLTLTTDLEIDGEQTLTATSHYLRNNSDSRIHWDGEVALPALPRTDWMLAWLQQWQAIPLTELPAHPESARFHAHWQLQGPDDTSFLNHVNGNLSVSGHLPQPWPIPAVAAVQGDLELALRADQGSWQADAARADLLVTKPADWITAVPEPLRPEALTVHLRPAESTATPAPGQLPLTIKVTSKQPSSVNLQGDITVTTAAPWAVQFQQVRLQANLLDSAPANMTLKGPQADVTVSGKVDAQALDLTFGPSSSVSAAQLAFDSEAESLTVNGLRAELAGMSLSARYDSRPGALKALNAKGPVVLSAKTVRHAALRPQGWRLKGQLQASLEALSVTGQLSAESGSQVRVTLNDRFADAFAATGQLTMEGQSGAEALARTLAAWPSLLTVSAGRLDAHAELVWPSGGKPDLKAHLTMTDLTGIFDRMAWSGLTGEAAVSLTGQSLTVATSGISLNQVNPGIPIGPVKMEGRFQSSLDSSGRQTLAIDQATAELLGGHARVDPGVFDLDQLPVRVPLTLTGIDLSKLMALYPADNLAGTGTLSGEVPLLLGPPAGVKIDAGRISARQPGGTLTLPAERLRSIGQGNQALDLVAKAMENFHYNTLNSTIDYDKDGTLTLGLHLEGSNPEVESGRPIVLNINLEEDLPALLTSLQLSGRVNDAVTERVRTLMEQRKAAKASSDDSGQ